MTVVSANTGTCVGVGTTATLITLPAGSSIPPGGCTIIVTVTSSTPGTVVNVTSALVAGGVRRTRGERPPAVVGIEPASRTNTVLSPFRLTLLLLALAAMGGLYLWRRS